jgi:diguanylate cyclase (GGDEF)-like protein
MDKEHFNKDILIIDKSEVIAKLIVDKITNELGFGYTYCKTFAETKKYLEKGGHNCFISILDINLSDSNPEESLNYLLSKGIPVIVTTSSNDDNIREKIINKNIIDYYIKKDFRYIDQLIKMIGNLIRNMKMKVLLIDDSEISRNYIVRLLKSQFLDVIELSSGKDVLKILEQNKDIKLVLTDYNMPDMNGIELLNKVRGAYSIDKLSVIGISAYGNSVISSHFLKEGANDFIYKPFSDEEFKLRINQNIEMLEYINTLKDISSKDYLTGLFNRRALIDIGHKLFENAKRGNIEITIGIVDIDNFKEINDKYGHYYGDIVIQQTAEILLKNFRSSDLVTRFGGDEFCIISVNLRKSNSFQHFDKIRDMIENKKIDTNKGEIKVTISVGVTNMVMKTLEETIEKADNLLYEAKKNGRNRISTD